MRYSLCHPDDALHNVIDVGEVSSHPAIVVDVNRPAFQDGLGEDKQRHVRPAPRTIDGKESQARGGKVVKVSIDVGHELIRFLGGRVQTDGVVDAVANRKRHQLVGSVHRTGRGEDEVLHVSVPAAFEHVREPDHVGLDVSVRVGQ